MSWNKRLILQPLCRPWAVRSLTVTAQRATDPIPGSDKKDGWLTAQESTMNRVILLTGTLLALIGAVPANAAPKHAARYYQTMPTQGQWSGSGVKIDGVDPGSPAARAGLRPGDSIVAINGSPINGGNDVDPFVARGGGRPITIDIRRGGVVVRLRATPRQGMLGYSYTYYPFCPGGKYCGSSDPPPYIPPPIPTPPPDPPPPFPIQN
jgi:hypothetical protein